MKYDSPSNNVRAHSSHFSNTSTTPWFIAIVAALALGIAAPVAAGQIGNCAAEYTSGANGGLNCTAADGGGSVLPTNIPTWCVIGSGVNFDVTTTFLNSSNAERYDQRYWVAIDGGDVRLSAADGGPSQCSVSGLTFGLGNGAVADLENNGDSCGDMGPGAVLPLTTIDNVTLDCIPNATGTVQFNTAVTWDTRTGLDCAIDDLRTNASISKAQSACVETTLPTESLGRVTVIKSAPEDDGTTDFAFNWSSTSPPQNPANDGLNPADPFFLADGGTQRILYALVKAGGSAVITVTEQDPSDLGYVLESIDCPGASTSPVPNGVAVTLTYDENNPGLADVICTFNNVVLVTNPAMSVSKSSTTGVIETPGTVDYDYVVSNLGDVALTGISLSDDNDNDDISCPSDTVAVGASMNCTATHTVTQAEIDANGSPTPASGFVSNTVTASSNETLDETDTLDIPINQTPLLNIDKVGTFNGGAFAQVGDTISYTFEVSNDGNVTLTNVAVTDPLVSPITCPSGNNPIVSLAPGDSETCTGSYTVVQADIDAGQRVNIGTGDSDQTDPPVTSSETVPLGQNPVLTVEKSSVTTLISAPGVVTYTYLVTNTGNQSLTGIALLDDNTDGVVSCTGTSLAPGGTTDCTAQHTVTQGELDANGSPAADSGNLVNNVTASSNEAPDATDTLSIPLAQTPSVLIEKAGTWNDDGSIPNIAEAGETISYTFDVTNDGNLTLTSVLVSDPLVPAITCPSGNAIPSMAPGATEQCTGSYTLLQGDVDAGRRDNTATATGSSPGGDGDVTDQDNDSVILPATADLLIDKAGTFNGGALAQVGDTIGYNFTVSNNGSETLNQVSVTDPLVPVITCPGGNPIPSLAVGQSEICTGSYTIDQADIDAGQVDNTATANSTEAGPVIAVETVLLPTSAVLDIDKVGTWNDDGSIPNVAEPGETIGYTFEVSNTGNITLTNISVTDPLVVSITCPSGNPIPSLLPGPPETCTGSYTITQTDVDNGARDNTATADSDETDPPVTDTETVPLPQGAELTVVKSSQTPSISSPTTVSYSYLVTNTSTSTLTGISLVDDNTTSSVSCPPEASLAPAASFTCTATRDVTQADIDANGSPVVDSGNLVNSVTASSNEASDATSTLSIPIVIAATITVDKSSTTSEVTAAGTVDYSYLVTNTGNVTLSGIRVDDDNDEDDAACTDATLAPNASTTCSATHIVTQAEIDANGSPAADSGVLVNNATAYGSSPRNQDDVTATDSLSIPFGASDTRFTVVKDFSDDNTAGVDVEITCNAGLPLHQEFTISEGNNVTFIVESFVSGEMDCEITEVVPDGYTASYDNGDAASALSCLFEEVTGGAYSCIITNELDPVTLLVTKQWDGVTEEDTISLHAEASYACYNVRAESDSADLSTVEGDLSFDGVLDAEAIDDLYPDFGGSSYCTVSELELDSAAEGDDSDCANVPISVNQGNSCTIYNTVFFEGIPALNQYGLMLLALLMLGMGAVTFRRFS